MPLTLWDRAGPAIHVPRGVQRPRFPFVPNKDSPQYPGLVAWYTFMPPGGLGPLLNFARPGIDEGTFLNFVVSDWLADKEMGWGADFARADRDAIQITGLFGSPAQGSIMAWFDLDENDDEGNEILSLGNNLSFKPFRAGDSSYGGFYRFSTGFNATRTATFNPTGAGVTHGAYVCDPGNSDQRVYANGDEILSTSHSDAIVYSQGVDTFIGRQGDGDALTDWDGRAFDIRFYDIALSGTVVQHAFNPVTRWDLYYELYRIFYSFPVAAAPPVADAFIPAGGHMGTS